MLETRFNKASLLPNSFGRAKQNANLKPWLGQWPIRKPFKILNFPIRVLCLDDREMIDYHYQIAPQIKRVFISCYSLVRSQERFFFFFFFDGQGLRGITKKTKWWWIHTSQDLVERHRQNSMVLVLAITRILAWKIARIFNNKHVTLEEIWNSIFFHMYLRR